MLYAKALDGSRITATKGLEANCPTCGETLTAKCGEIVCWHWAHKASNDCDPWSEGETRWHVGWKELVPEHWREVTVGPHRADIRTADGLVVELQHSPISTIEIREREAFYGDMVWVVDARDFVAHLNIRLKVLRNAVSTYPWRKFAGYSLKEADHVTFGWKWLRKSWHEASKPIYMDLGGGFLLLVTWLGDRGGTGRLLDSGVAMLGLLGRSASDACRDLAVDTAGQVSWCIHRAAALVGSEVGYGFHDSGSALRAALAEQGVLYDGPPDPHAEFR